MKVVLAATNNIRAIKMFWEANKFSGDNLRTTNMFGLDIMSKKKHMGLPRDL